MAHLGDPVVPEEPHLLWHKHKRLRTECTGGGERGLSVGRVEDRLGDHFRVQGHTWREREGERVGEGYT